MADDAKKTYRLYVLKPDADGIGAAVKERFYRATPRYVLVYTAGEIAAKHAEITENEAHRLSKGDAEWLRGCFVVLAAEELKKRESEIAAVVSERLNALEVALKAEKEKIEQEG